MDKKEKNLVEEISKPESLNSEKSKSIPEKAILKKPQLLKPISILDTKISDFIEWLQNISLFKLAVILSEGALLFAIVSYVITIPSRNKQEIQEARNVLRDESDYEYSHGRIAALKILHNKGCQGNPGLEAPGANMANLTLHPCESLSFTQGSLKVKKHAMDLSYSNLAEADLSGANLVGINLRGSNLQGANLANANLEGADLRDANLQGANLAQANLKKAMLQESKLDNSNLYGAELEAANFSEASLVNVRALWANLHNAMFYRAKLQSANFNQADLRGADFYKANLENASLRFADLTSMTNERGAQLQPTHLLETQLKGADLWGAKISSTFQIKRAKNWQETKKKPNWEKLVKQARLPRLRIALIKPETPETLFNFYELGMRRAANRRVEIWTVSHPSGVENEARIIKQLIKEGIDGIILRPEDSIKSLDALKLASDAGVAIITLGFCFDPIEAQDLAIACYSTDNFQMGYDSGQDLVQWAEKNLQTDTDFPSKLVQLALIDTAVYDSYYPYLQGALKAIQESDISFQIVDSLSVASNSDITKVKELLKNNPSIQMLWGGSNLATEVGLEAVIQSGLNNKVKVFGVSDLSRDKAEMLLDPNSPINSIIDQSGLKVGYDATKKIISVLRKDTSGADYQVYKIEHSLLTKDDPDPVNDFLENYGWF